MHEKGHTSSQSRSLYFMNPTELRACCQPQTLKHKLLQAFALRSKAKQTKLSTTYGWSNQVLNHAVVQSLLQAFYHRTAVVQVKLGADERELGMTSTSPRQGYCTSTSYCIEVTDTDGVYLPQVLRADRATLYVFASNLGAYSSQ